MTARGQRIVIEGMKPENVIRWNMASAKEGYSGRNPLLLLVMSYLVETTELDELLASDEWKEYVQEYFKGKE